MNTLKFLQKEQAREEPAPFVSYSRGATIVIEVVRFSATEGDVPDLCKDCSRDGR